MKKFFFTIAAVMCVTTLVSADNNMSAKAELQQMTKREFRQTVWNPNMSKKFKYDGKQPIVIDFNAVWCKPCKKVQPYLEELQAEYGDKVTFYSIDIDKESDSTPDYPKVFKFENIPALVIIKPGTDKRPTVYRIGGMTKEQIRNAIDTELADNN